MPNPPKNPMAPVFRSAFSTDIVAINMQPDFVHIMIRTKLGHEITAHLGSLVWERSFRPPSHRADPAHRWLREMIRSAAAVVAA